MDVEFRAIIERDCAVVDAGDVATPEELRVEPVVTVVRGTISWVSMLVLPGGASGDEEVRDEGEQPNSDKGSPVIFGGFALPLR